MIKVTIFQDSQGNICGFDADDHSKSIVCSAVSILTLNAINSIEAFTDQKISYDYHEDGGFLRFMIEDFNSEQINHDADLLLKSMLLGLQGIQKEYRRHLKIIYKEVL